MTRRLSFLLFPTLVCLTGPSLRAAETAESLQKKSRAVLAQLEGEITILGLKEPVEVLRDRWGVPHIYARNTPDLFFAQGFVAAQDRQDDPGTVKTFYVARIRDAEVGSEVFSVPRDFDLKTHFGETIGIFVGSEPFRFRVRFTKAMAAWVAEVRWHPKQKMTALPNGELELELPAGSLFEARRLVLSFGRDAVAMAPPALVEALRAETEEMAATYRAGGL